MKTFFKALGTIFLALVVFRIAYGMFGPPGAIVAMVGLCGWWSLRAAGVTIGSLFPGVFKRKKRPHWPQ